MPTVDYALTFDADAQGFTKDGASVIDFAFDGGDGSPSAGSVKFFMDFFAGSLDHVIESASKTLTWEDMGVPPGRLVTGVEWLGVMWRREFTSPFFAFQLPRTDVILRLYGAIPAPEEQIAVGPSQIIQTPHSTAWAADFAPGFNPVTPSLQTNDYRPSNSTVKFYLFIDVEPFALFSTITGAHWLDTIQIRIHYEDDEVPVTPWPLEDHWGRYHRAHGDEELQTFYRRADFAAPPPFVLQTLPAGNLKRDNEPRMAYDDRDRLHCVFTRKFIVNTPASLQVTALTRTRARVTWTNTSTLTPSFRLWTRPVIPGGFGAPQVTAIPSGSTSYELDGLTPGTAYRFHLDAIVTSPTPGTSDDAGPIDLTMPP